MKKQEKNTGLRLRLSPCLRFLQFIPRRPHRGDLDIGIFMHPCLKIEVLIFI